MVLIIDLVCLIQCNECFKQIKSSYLFALIKTNLRFYFISNKKISAFMVFFYSTTNYVSKNFWHEFKESGRTFTKNY